MSDDLKEKFEGILGVIIFLAVIFGGIWFFSRPSSGPNLGSPEATDTQVVPDPNGYINCTEAHNAGVYDIPESSPAYRSRQDADHDGIACEHYLGN